MALNARIKQYSAEGTLRTAALDSLNHWHGLRQIDTGEIICSSWDCRSRSSRPQGADSAIANGAAPKTVAWHANKSLERSRPTNVFLSWRSCSTRPVAGFGLTKQAN